MYSEYGPDPEDGYGDYGPEYGPEEDNTVMIVILSLAGIVLLVVGYFCLFSSTPDQDKIARGAIMIGDTPVKIPLIGKTDDDLCTPTAAGVALGVTATAGVLAAAYACYDPKGFRSIFGDKVGDATGTKKVDNTYLYASVGAGALALGGLGLYSFRDKIPEWLKFWKKFPKWLMFWNKIPDRLQFWKKLKSCPACKGKEPDKKDCKECHGTGRVKSKDTATKDTDTDTKDTKTETTDSGITGGTPPTRLPNRGGNDHLAPETGAPNPGGDVGSQATPAAADENSGGDGDKYSEEAKTALAAALSDFHNMGVTDLKPMKPEEKREWINNIKVAVKNAAGEVPNINSFVIGALQDKGMLEVPYDF